MINWDKFHYVNDYIWNVTSLEFIICNMNLPQAFAARDKSLLDESKLI